MKKKKGFTLIELLAVIVILAIIALIATPVILNIIEKSRKSAFTRSLESVVRAGKIYYMESLMDDTIGEINFRCTKDGCISTDKTDSNGNPIELDIEGSVGTGDITIDNKGNVSFELEYAGYCGTKEIDENKINVEKGNCVEFDPENDTTPPIINSVNYTKTQDSIKIVVDAIDRESRIKYYEYSIDNGENYTEQQTNNVYEFKDLTPGTYYIKVRVYSGAYEYHPEIGMTESKTIEITLESEGCPVPSIVSVSPKEWSGSKTIVVDYGVGCEGQYSIDEEETWNDGNEVTVTENQTIIFKNESETLSYQVTGIKPVIELGEVNIGRYNIIVPYELTVDDAATPTCEYGTSTSYGSTGTIQNGTCVMHNLIGKTTYYYKITVSQSNGDGTDEITGSGTTLEPTYIAAVYYNPTTGTKCTESQYNTNLNNHLNTNITGTTTKHTTPTELKSGCMKWYVYDDNGDGTVDMLLDHNTTARVQWNAASSNKTAVEVLQALNTDTGSWKTTARLITADEIAKITNHPTFNIKTSTNPYNFEINDYPLPEGYVYTGAYAWLYDYTKICNYNGCEEKDNHQYPTYSDDRIDTSAGYWTNTKTAGSSDSAWLVHYNGILISFGVYNPNFGVRPVVTISKTTLGL